LLDSLPAAMSPDLTPIEESFSACMSRLFKVIYMCAIHPLFIVKAYLHPSSCTWASSTQWPSVVSPRSNEVYYRRQGTWMVQKCRLYYCMTEGGV
jgi:hypothetical protein